MAQQAQAKQVVAGLLSRVDPGCVRLLHHGICPGRRCQGVSYHPHSRHLGIYANAGGTAVGRLSVWTLGRPVRPAAHSHGQCADLLDARVRLWLRANAH